MSCRVHCNPGHDPQTGDSIGMADRCANFFPWVNVFDYKDKMAQACCDLWFSLKASTPRGGELAGEQRKEGLKEVQGLPYAKGRKGQKTYTGHGQRSARYLIKDTCINCPRSRSEKEADYQVDAIQN